MVVFIQRKKKILLDFGLIAAASSDSYQMFVSYPGLDLLCATCVEVWVGFMTVA